MRPTTWIPMLFLAWSVGVAAHQAPGQPAAGGGHSGLAIPKTRLLAPEARVPFVLDEKFPVPVVEVTLNGTGPWRLAVDTAMSGTVLLRKELVGRMGLPVLGTAMVGDSSGTDLKPADVVRISTMQVGQLDVQDIMAIGFTGEAAHLAQVPDDVHGILGNRIYAELLMTLDYAARTVTFRAGELPADGTSVIPFKSAGNVMEVDVNLAGRLVSLIVDSGSRGSITLPASMAAGLPLAGKPVAIDSASTVSRTYQRTAARLAGKAGLAGTTLADPEIEFADDERTPKLIGYRILKQFVLTIDQAHGRLRWEAAR